MYVVCVTPSATASCTASSHIFSTVIVSPTTDATRTLVTLGGWFVWGSGRKILTLACFPFASLPRYEKFMPACVEFNQSTPTPSSK